MHIAKPNETAAELIARYGPKRTGPYVKLRPYAQLIQELRLNRASYDTIVAILRERHGVETSDTTVRHFCRDVLQEPPPRGRGRKPAHNAPPATAPKIISPLTKTKGRCDGPQIAEVEFIDES